LFTLASDGKRNVSYLILAGWGGVRSQSELRKKVEREKIIAEEKGRGIRMRIGNKRLNSNQGFGIEW
jgi:hypothetical protein